MEGLVPVGLACTARTCNEWLGAGGSTPQPFSIAISIEVQSKVLHPGDVVRLLHFADLHLDTPFRWAPREVARARRWALRDTLLRICKLADEQRADALTCGGDLYEQERFTPDTAEFLRSTFAELYPLPVFFAEGADPVKTCSRICPRCRGSFKR